ncbi:MAG TPA: carboxypeptidase-like regulatory domain-containing protein [Pyrinomonadaceae bacterium]|nr:carboxypeptidase-like regulatory domain-containing protein [Pyrinomonadaceae bacterium]
MTALLLLALACLSAFAQGASSGSLAGTVTDPSGAVVANASVVVRSNATNQEFTAQTADNGTFNVPSLASGMYTVTVTAQGFKQAVVQNVKVDVGTPSSINLALEVGAVNDTVTITAAGGELLQTQTATVGTTITGR